MNAGMPTMATNGIQELSEGPLDIVGDVHGEYDALVSLLKKLGYDDLGRHREGRSGLPYRRLEALGIEAGERLGEQLCSSLDSSVCFVLSGEVIGAVAGMQYRPAPGSAIFDLSSNCSSATP